VHALERLGVALPVIQAGMGGGIAGHELAAAVSEAGGLGTIGILDPPALRKELRRARELTSKPVAVNLLLPFTRGAHWEVAREAEVIVTFWGAPVRRAAGTWIHQCGSVEEALAAHHAGADALIVQGVEAGGHVRGCVAGLELLERVRRALPSCPLLLAGGVAEPADVRRALEHGAIGVVAGTRFVLSHESRAHPDYQQRLIQASETLLTELFGFGWSAPHRVVANAATARWLRRDSRGPAAGRLANRLAAPAVSRLPLSLAGRLTGLQRAQLPMFGPSPPLKGSPGRLVDVAPLYAGESVARIRDVRPAGELTRELAG
jgi:NAD(P)H-dependent flavin oxidoreductase YrpB (nitropropane dioxygenase family)